MYNDLKTDINNSLNEIYENKNNQAKGKKKQLKT